MLLRMLWRYVRGYVEVRCDGGLFAKFFNLLMRAGVPVFYVRLEGNTARFCAYIDTYKRMRAVAKKCRCNMRVERKHGLYFASKKVNHKAALAAGFAAFFAVIYILGNMVFTIDIKGPSTIPKYTLLQSLEDNGLTVGMWRGDVDVKRVEQGVLLGNERLAWVAVNLSFGKATIEVKDKIVEEETAQTGDGLIAKRDAQVKSIDVTAGEALVKPGDTVIKGQNLAQPAAFTLDGSWTMRVEARVLGYTNYSCTFQVSKNHVFREPTGNTLRYHAFQLGDTVLPVSIRQNSFQYFDQTTYKKPARLFSVELPVTIITTEYVEVTQTSGMLNEQEARVMLDLFQAEYEKRELAGCEILNRDIAYEDSGNAYVRTIQYLCLEDIGVYM